MCSLHYKYNHCNIAIVTQLTENHNGNVGESVTYVVFVIWALVVYLICTPSASPQAEGVHIRQTTHAHVTDTKCYTVGDDYSYINM